MSISIALIIRTMPGEGNATLHASHTKTVENLAFLGIYRAPKGSGNIFQPSADTAEICSKDQPLGTSRVWG